MLHKSRDERQEESRIKWIKNKGVGTIVGCTGFGKTRIALNTLSSFNKKYPQFRYLVVVPTDNLKVQWLNQLSDLGLELNGTVEVVNTVIRRSYKVDVLVLDECHRINSDTFRDVFNTVEYKFILGLTATFERLDDKHREVMEKYCPVIDTITLEEALFNNWVSAFKEYQVLIDVDDIDVYKEYNRQFTENFEFFGFDWNTAMACIGKDGYKMKIQLRDRMCRKGTEEEKKQIWKSITYHAAGFMRAIQARKAFINNHPKKIELARKIIEARPNSKIITFSNNIKMAESIGLGNVYSGRDSKKKARLSLEEFNNQKVGVLHSIAKMNEGVDIRGLNVAIIIGLDSSEIKSVQRRGRVIRFEEGKSAEIFNIVINDSVETKWFENSHKTSDYITIDEQGLYDVLAGKEPKLYNKQIKDFTFRW